MFIYEQDPYPGRCRNLRTDASDPYKARFKRCLGFEDQQHVCEFEPDAVNTSLFQFNSYTVQQPQPWTGKSGS
jgi:hypothetical protein